jgi:hypothetical protein
MGFPGLPSLLSWRSFTWLDGGKDAFAVAAAQAAQAAAARTSGGGGCGGDDGL